MDRGSLITLLDAYKNNNLSAEEIIERLRGFPYEDLGFARIDHHRPIRQGFPEVIFGVNKTSEQIAEIAQRILSANSNVLITRTTEEAFQLVRETAPDARFHELARAITIVRRPVDRKHGTVSVITAGTSDIPVAEEAAVTAEALGNLIDKVYDVGVAGLHRLLHVRDRLDRARVVICVAGMEGALPSVVGGLVSVPVIAVPSSVGYGSSFGGVAALLAMLNSCAANVVVVNIDNGFGAAVTASLINSQDHP